MDTVSASPWRTSSYSGQGGQNCVQVASQSRVLVRDTKDHGRGPVLEITPSDWRRLATSLKQA